MEYDHPELLPSTPILLIKIMWKIIFSLFLTLYGQLLITTLLQISLLQHILAQEDITISVILLALTGIITIGHLRTIKRRRNRIIQEQKEIQQHQHAIDIQHQVDRLHKQSTQDNNWKQGILF